MEILTLFIIIGAVTLILGIALTIFFIKGIQHIRFEKESKDAQGSLDVAGSEVIDDQNRIVLKKFYTGFMILELSLIIYFIILGVIILKIAK